MTIYDLRCDCCGSPLAGPGRSVRFRYHPRDLSLGDDAGLACGSCWNRLVERWAPPSGSCARCGSSLRDAPCLFVVPVGEMLAWRLCRTCAITFLNELRTVEPKLDPDTFVLPE